MCKEELSYKEYELAKAITLLERLKELQENYTKLDNAYWEVQTLNVMLKREVIEWKSKAQQHENESDRAIDEGLAWIELYQDCLKDVKEIALHVQSYANPNLEDDVYSDMEKILKRIEEMEVHADRKV